jgi:hypothetical protein
MVAIALNEARMSRPFSVKATSTSPASMDICDW